MRQLANILFAALILFVVAMPVSAHGVRINYAIDAASGEITVSALYDTGTPLVSAAVTIFAPDDLINPWMSGTTDEAGDYRFLPDYDIAGFWDIQVRQAGHGGLINVEIQPEMAPLETSLAAESSTDSDALLSQNGSTFIISGDARFEVRGNIIITSTDAQTAPPAQDTILASGGSSGFTPMQIVVMSISVIWGFIGTALYFVQRRK